MMAVMNSYMMVIIYATRIPGASRSQPSGD
jgi:hypothetical protein